MTKTLISADEARELKNKYVNPDTYIFIEKITTKLMKNIVKQANLGKDNTNISINLDLLDCEEIVKDLTEVLEDAGYTIVSNKTKLKYKLKIIW